MKVSVKQVYTSVACNRSPEIVDWNNEGLICFGATNAVVIYNTKEKEKDPLTVRSHHRSQVNSVKWIHKADNTCTELLSCSADKTAAIWSLEDGQWNVSATLTGHNDGVMCIHGVYIKDDLIVYTGSIDSTVKVWARKGVTTTLKQTISLHSGLCLTLHAHILPSLNKPVLFCALDDHKIHIFAGDEYHKVHTLVGHEDWVRGLDVISVDDTTLMLASASQDTYIRLWQIQRHTPQPVSSIRVEEKVFHAYDAAWSVKLEAVLSGHEGWVYGVQWHPYSYEGPTKKPVYRLLSSSLDKTLIIWEPESSPSRGEGDCEGVWVERVRVGEVGGNGLGFYGSRFGPQGEAFLGHGYNGSFHIWKYCKETCEWKQRAACGGHSAAVHDVCWAPRARTRLLASAARDQTTRLHAPCPAPRPAPSAAGDTQHGGHEWHEIARPQVHGYDMASIAMLDSTTFASAAEEKVIRVFTAPHNFITNFKNLVGDVLVEEGTRGPEGASVPSLGLSNKAIFSGDGDTGDLDDNNDGYFMPVDLKEPPTEETLVQHTLWPEVQKLYGHGFEVHALAATATATATGHLLASACRATTAEHAAVLIWDASTWQQIQKLISHSLTVTQLSFSPDSQRLLSVSRDRRWTVFQRRQGSNLFDIAACTDKTNGVHSRIIWCCAWAHDGSMFGTGSRDGKICVWSKSETMSESSLKEYSVVGSPLQVAGASVTALAFAPVRGQAARAVAAGFESGCINIYAFGDGWTLLRELDNSAAHHLTVKRLTFNPQCEESREHQELLLASGGDDHLVRVYSMLVS